jgi:hypothetical protein
LTVYPWSIYLYTHAEKVRADAWDAGHADLEDIDLRAAEWIWNRTLDQAPVSDVLTVEEGSLYPSLSAKAEIPVFSATV